MTVIRELRIRTRGGNGEAFFVDKATIDTCAELLKDPDAVLHIMDKDGDAYIPVRHVVGMFVPAWVPKTAEQAAGG